MFNLIKALCTKIEFKIVINMYYIYCNLTNSPESFSSKISVGKVKVKNETGKRL